MPFQIGHKNYIKSKPITWIVNENGCWICTSHCLSQKGRFGYPQKCINYKMVYISHIMYEKHKGPIPPGMCVLHNCPGGDNPTCINPEHLWLGTKGDNARDKEHKGRGNQIKGEKHYLAKLTEQKVLEIRCAVGTQREIAKIFKISPTSVWLIKNKINWKMVA